MHSKHYVCTQNYKYFQVYCFFVDLTFFIFVFYETVFYATLS